jgi:nucleoside-diphosphate-sugar epimerase
VPVRLLVTGGAGCIGSVVASLLVEEQVLGSCSLTA